MMIIAGIFSIMTILLFILGNFQGFLDSTQAVLLIAAEKTLLALIMFGFYVIVCIIVRIFTEHTFHPGKLAGTLFVIICAAAAAIGIASIRILVMPGT